MFVARKRLWAWLPALSGVAGCTADPASTTVQPVLVRACVGVVCAAEGVCVADERGTGSCVCAIGYTGDTCERCELDFHRDARDRCVSDKRCAAQTMDPCAPHGSCTDAEGSLVCACEPGYEGPRCNLCADDWAWSVRALCEPLRDAATSDAASEPELPDAGSTDSGTTTEPCARTTRTETFELTPSWPNAPDTCASIALLSTSNLTLRSREGDGFVALCAPSTFNTLGTRYVELEAGPTRPAELQIPGGANTVSFKYSATLEALSLDVLANGRIVTTLDVAKRAGATFSLSEDSPITTLAFRSRSPYFQRISLDDVSYTTVDCP